jgi:triosephosphate isomerase
MMAVIRIRWGVYPLRELPPEVSEGHLRLKYIGSIPSTRRASMARRRLIVGNWKMNLTVPEGESLVEALLPVLSQLRHIDIVLCPSFPSLYPLGSLMKGKGLYLGAQDVFWEDRGAFTGQVSVPMLVDVGCTFCIVGHSERRGRFGANSFPPELLSYFGENEHTINEKIRRLLYHQVTPILCIGETLEERIKGNTEEVLYRQLEGALKGVDSSEVSSVVIAYEPVWSIGTGENCDPEEACRVAKWIRSLMGKTFSEDVGERIRILYGGSVTGRNAGAYFKFSDIDGALVGGASLSAEDFKRILFSA